MAATIDFKYPKLSEELMRAHPSVLAILNRYAEIAGEFGEKSIVVTCIERTAKGTAALYGRAGANHEHASPHDVFDSSGKRIMPGSRAIDIRAWNLGGGKMTGISGWLSICQIIATRLNREIHRPDKYPSAYFHSIKPENPAWWHTHIQCFERWN